MSEERKTEINKLSKAQLVELVIETENKLANFDVDAATQAIIEEKQAEIEKIQSDASKKITEIAQLQQAIIELNEQIQNHDATAGDIKNNHTVKIDKVEYEILFPKFRYNGIEYTAKELASNKELAAELIENESGVLAPISK
jgi:glutaredoxin 2